MLQLFTHRDFDRWRTLARQLLADGVLPKAVLWSDWEADSSLLATSGSFGVPVGVAATRSSGSFGSGIDVESAHLGSFGQDDQGEQPLGSFGKVAGDERSLGSFGSPELDADVPRPDFSDPISPSPEGADAGNAGQYRPLRGSAKREGVSASSSHTARSSGNASPSSTSLVVPRAFVNLATIAACHRDADRWNLLYRSLWRLTHGEEGLLAKLTDDDILRLHTMERAVRRDRHKMTAFVRFRSVAGDNGQTHYVAWHRPDHYIVRLTAPFFRNRFAAMHWSILTPDDSVSWDGSALQFGAGVPESDAPGGDELEALWRTYYANIFNPARIKIRAMKRELPVRHWPTLPETELIPQLLADAPQRVQDMIRKAKQNARPGSGPKHTARESLFDPPAHAADASAISDGSTAPRRSTAARGIADNIAPPSGAAAFIPESRSLEVLSEAAKSCRGCHLCEIGSQTVFGEGPKAASVMFVGEQPGDQEDRQGKPFVGPAGQLLNEVLEEVGIDRTECYVTNSVKHFKWEPRGTRRIHSKPSSREVSACLPWLVREIEVVQPKVLVCLGSTAAQALLGRDFRVTQSRGEIMETQWSPWTMATIHPSALLRIPDEQLRAQSMEEFKADLRSVAKQIAKLKEGA